jgi:hypothetical protein
MKLLILLMGLTACASSTKSGARNDMPEWRKRCSALESAIEEIAKSKKYDVQAIHKIFQENAKVESCDDASYAQGMSDITVKSLATSFRGVVQEVANKQAMLLFVLKHIDSTTDWEDLDKVTENATKACPATVKLMCDQIKLKSMAASKEAKSVK